MAARNGVNSLGFGQPEPAMSPFNSGILRLPTSPPRAPDPLQPAPGAASISVANDNNVTVDPISGWITIVNADGSVDLLSPSEAKAPGDSAKFKANLADHIDAMELGRIASELIRGIDTDEMSRQEWLTTRAQGIRMLGLKIEPARSAIETASALEGMSTVRHPLLLKSTLDFQANARGELLPADGPVKVANKLNTETGQIDQDAEQLEGDLNWYLTVGAPEYYPDTDRALFYTGFGGCSFKKVYNCPLRQRPVSESVDAKDLIVSNAATDLQNSGRTTHRLTMRTAILRRMQIAGAYRDVPISMPSGVVPNAVDRQIAQTQGISLDLQQMEDREHTIYECYCELDIAGFEDKKGGKPTGLPLPYRVVIEKDSQQILEIRRNWREDDPTKMARVKFVKYPFVPGLGFYDIGLIHIVGNTTNALTTAWRELLDAGMFANFPGFLYEKIVGRQNTNEFRVPPGGGAPIETNGHKLNESVMPLPYKDISVAFAQFVEKIAETGEQVGGSPQVQIAEGRADAPVGTTLALIEQATKLVGAVHKRLHTAQMEEFGLLKECFRENPQAFINALKKKGGAEYWNEERFLRALNNAALVPQADPNTPSHLHRIMKAMAIIQLDKAYPGAMLADKVVKRVLHMIQVDDADDLLNPNPQGPPPDPKVAVQLKQLDDKAQGRQHQMIMEQLKGAAAEKNHENEMRLEAFQAQNEAANDQRAAALQLQESADQAADRENRAHLAEVGLREAEIGATSDIETEEIKRDAAEIKADGAVAAAKAKPKPVARKPSGGGKK